MTDVIEKRALELVLPWPAKGLSPNDRLHYLKKAGIVADARYLAFVLALEAGWGSAQLAEGKLLLELDFYPPPRIKAPDDDNMVGRFKPYRDGLAQALRIDDGRFRCRPEVMDERRPRGQVVVRVKQQG